VHVPLCYEQPERLWTHLARLENFPQHVGPAKK